MKPLYTALFVLLMLFDERVVRCRWYDLCQAVEWAARRAGFYGRYGTWPWDGPPVNFPREAA